MKKIKPSTYACIFMTTWIILLLIAGLCALSGFLKIAACAIIGWSGMLLFAGLAAMCETIKQDFENIDV
jgi:hypothetical protein